MWEHERCEIEPAMHLSSSFPHSRVIGELQDGHGRHPVWIVSHRSFPYHFEWFANKRGFRWRVNTPVHKAPTNVWFKCWLSWWMVRLDASWLFSDRSFCSFSCDDANMFDWRLSDYMKTSKAWIFREERNVQAAGSSNWVPLPSLGWIFRWLQSIDIPSLGAEVGNAFAALLVLFASPLR